MLAKLKKIINSNVTGLQIDGTTSSTYDGANGNSADYEIALNEIRSALNSFKTVFIVKNYQNEDPTAKHLYEEAVPDTIQFGNAQKVTQSFWVDDYCEYILLKSSTYKFAFLLSYTNYKIAYTLLYTDGTTKTFTFSNDIARTDVTNIQVNSYYGRQVFNNIFISASVRTTSELSANDKILILKTNELDLAIPTNTTFPMSCISGQSIPYAVAGHYSDKSLYLYTTGTIPNNTTLLITGFVPIRF